MSATATGGMSAAATRNMAAIATAGMAGWVARAEERRSRGGLIFLLGPEFQNSGEAAY